MNLSSPFKNRSTFSFFVIVLYTITISLQLPPPNHPTVQKGTIGQSKHVNATQINWDTHGFNAQHTNVNPFEKSINASNVSMLVPAWNVTLGKSLNSPTSPIIDNGIIYTSLDNTKGPNAILFAIDALTGKQLWTYTIGNSIGEPTVANGIIYFGSIDGTLYALNSTTGAKLWSYDGPGKGLSPAKGFGSTVVSNGVVYVGSEADGQMYAFNATTGALLWRFQGGGPIELPAVADNIVYAGSWDRNIYALNAQTRVKLWGYPTGDYVWSYPTIVNGIIYIASFDNNLYALNAKTGKRLWNYPIGGYSEGVSVYNGIVYVGSTVSLTSALYALNATTGTLVWKYSQERYVTTITVANGVLYAAFFKNNAIAFDAKTGAILWRFPIVADSFIVVNGTVYIGSLTQTGDSQLYAFHLSS